MAQLSVSNGIKIVMSGIKSQEDCYGSLVMGFIKDNGNIYYYKGEEWVRTGAEPDDVTAVVVGMLGLWCLDKNGTIYQWNENPTNSKWTKDTGMPFADTLSCDNEGNLYCTAKKDIFIRTKQFVGLGTEDGKPFTLNPWEKTSIPPVPVSNAGTWEYKVGAKDTLDEIVKVQYGVKGTKVIANIADEIVRLNELKDVKKLPVGQKLTMPPLSFR